MSAATAAAIGSVAVGAYSAYSASQNQSDALNAQQQAANQQAQVAEDQLNFGKQQYGDWKSMFYPVAGELKSLAEREMHPDYAAITADVGNAFDTSQGINMRNMQRMGVKPTDGAVTASNTAYGLGRATALAGGMNTARQQAQQQQFGNLATVYGLGSGMMNAGNMTANQGFGNLQGAYNNQANMFGRNAAMYGQAASAGAGMLGYGLNQFANNGGFGNWFGGGSGGGSDNPTGW